MAAIKDVARYAGFSVSAVSKYLKNPDSVRPDTKAKIEEAIRVLNYRPSMIARALRTKNTNTLLLVTSQLRTVPGSEVVYCLQKEAEKLGYAMIIMSEENIEKIILSGVQSPAMSEAIVDGIIYCMPRKKALMKKHIRMMNQIPKVSISRSPLAIDVPNATRDEDQAVYMATRHVISLGHERIAFITCTEDDELPNNRRYGFLRAMTEAGLPVRPEYRYYNEIEMGNVMGGYLGLKQIMQNAVRPTAVVTDNDFIAIGCSHYAHEHGLRVPEDIAITGYMDAPPAAIAYPPITTVPFPSVEIAHWAMETLVQMIREGLDPGSFPENTCFDSKIIIRRSTDINKPQFVLPTPRLTGETEDLPLVQ